MDFKNLWNMQKKNRSKLFPGAAPIIFLLTLPLIFVIPFGMNQFLSNSEITFSKTSEEQYSLKVNIARLVRGEDLKRLETTGFACDVAQHSIVCVTTQHVLINTTKNITVHIPTNQTVQEERNVKPYARQEDKYLLQFIKPIKILHKNTTHQVCQYNYQIPAVIFSSGLTGNLFHEFNDIIIPLFITIKHFKSQVLLILEDYNPTFVRKYSKIMSRLSVYEVMNPAANRSVHCFPGSIVGLKYHDNLALNSTEIPGGYTMPHFRQFLRETYNLKHNHVSQIKTPTLMLVSREKTRRFLNEDEIINMIKEVGFNVIAVRTQEVSNLNKFAQVVNSCSVLVGVHGAGLTNELFLPGGAVMVQVEPLGLEWASATYFGNPSGPMGLNYIRYNIRPEESSLVEAYGRNSSVVMDPTSVFVKGYSAARAVYVDGQDVRVDVVRFREIIVMALKMVRN